MLRPKRFVLLIPIIAANALICFGSWAVATGRLDVTGGFFQNASTAIGLGPGWTLGVAIWGWGSTSTTTFHLLVLPLVVSTNTLVYSLIEVLLFKFGQAVWRFSKAKNLPLS